MVGAAPFSEAGHAANAGKEPSAAMSYVPLVGLGTQTFLLGWYPSKTRAADVC
jgi:hypothetical protein